MIQSGQRNVKPSTTTRPLAARSTGSTFKLATDGIPVTPRATEREHGLGEIRVDRLDARTVGAWRKRLPEGSAWHAHKALRQLLSYAVRTKLVSENVAKLVPNPEPRRRAVPIFGSWEELERLAEDSHRNAARCPSS